MADSNFAQRALGEKTGVPRDSGDDKLEEDDISL